MAGIFNRSIFNNAIFNTAPVESVGRARPWKQKWRQELVDALLEAEEAKPTRPVKRAIQRAQKALQTLKDDTEAIQALRAEVSRLEQFKPLPAPKLQALQRTLAEAWLEAIERDDEEIILLLH